MAGRFASHIRAGCAVLAVLLAGAHAPAAAQEDALVRTATRQCAERDGMAKSSCYEQILLPLAERGELGRALRVLEQIGAIDQEVRRNGHMYVHGLGIAAYDPARDAAETFTECTELFHAGCYHGVIQAHFSGLAVVDSAAVNDFCGRVRERRPDQWTYFQCVHGLGHGLTINAAHDLPAGLAGCDLLAGIWEQESCYGGAFMENVGNATQPHHNALVANLPAADPGGGAGGHAGHGQHAHAAQTSFKAIDPADPHHPCSVVGEKYLAACYGMQTTVMLHLNGNDFGKAARTCDSAPAAARRTCHQSLGRDASGFAEQDHEDTIRLCRRDESPNGVWCYVGAVKAITDWSGTPDEGHGFCARVERGPARVRCVEALGEQIGIMMGTPEARRTACRAGDVTLSDVCLYGARVLAVKPAALQALDADGR
jgi:hypothetical protein